MEIAGATATASTEAGAQSSPTAAGDPPDRGRPVMMEPDLDFIRRLGDQAGESYRKCFQCGTCSASCALSPVDDPFPRKEMAWAVWGLKDRLLADPDVWLCHQCNDCSISCPRGARPGDVLAAVRQESMLHFAVPGFLARWVSQPKYIPLLLAIPALLLSLALLVSGLLTSALGLTRSTSGKIVFSYSSLLPHWVINTFFLTFAVLVLVSVTVGVMRFWRALKAGDGAKESAAAPSPGLMRSIGSTARTVFGHERFVECKANRTRFVSHLAVSFGFLALSLVAFWVVTARYNPLVQDSFVYPFSFWSPWKILANLGGAALLAGCLLMVVARLRDREVAGASRYTDWALIATLGLVTLTGFATEAVHYIRLEPHRHAVYLVHLILVFALLVYLPYSKLAHLIYRTTAIFYSEYSGRSSAREQP